MTTQSTLVRANMPQQFKYPTTWVVLDATEIYVQKPHFSELQQMTFSNIRTATLARVFVGISAEGVITFCIIALSMLYI